jgi:hypothetical protein
MRKDLTWRRCRRFSDLATYRLLTEEHLGIVYPWDYLQSSHIRLGFDEHGVMQGGYVLATDGPYRVLNSIPGDEGEAIRARFPEYKTAEITGLWLSKAARAAGASRGLWRKMWGDVLRLGKSYFVFGYTLEKTGLARAYQQLGSRPLFRGQTLLMPGMAAPEVESIEYTTRARMLALIPLRARKLKKKARA